MLINRKVDYALRVLTYLASNEKKISTAELSKRLRVPRLFLAKILNELSRNGVVTAERGKLGGVVLKDPRTSLKQVILMFDPGISFNKCLKKGNTCFLGKNCVLHSFLAEAQSDLFRKLETVTIESITNTGN
jgi:Rrf2 family protein